MSKFLAKSILATAIAANSQSVKTNEKQQIAQAVDNLGDTATLLSSQTELITQCHCQRSEAIARAGIASLRSQ
ncbi:hypothetical protein [Nostoc sp.]|uniref:hypothetical protein n=1 Tax=Nostoc sp. TaxID=1180 RepID=UPI002FFBA2D2